MFVKRSIFYFKMGPIVIVFNVNFYRMGPIVKAVSVIYGENGTNSESCEYILCSIIGQLRMNLMAFVSDIPVVAIIT